MKARFLVLMLAVAAFAATAGWFVGRRSGSAKQSGEGGGRKILFYQSAMHPWIKSDKPGNCTICGMKLVPVYEGEKGFETSSDVVSLSSNSVNVINVQTEAVRRQPLIKTLRVAGRIEDNDAKHRFVSAYIDARIERLAVNFVGAEVIEGAPLATIYSPALLTAEHEYLALLGQSQSTNHATLRKEQQNLVSAAAYRLKRLGLTESQINELEQNQESEARRDIRAPMSGTVVQRFVYEGQYVKEGDKLFELADFSTMWFQFDAYERDLAWIKIGQEVQVTTPAVAGKIYSAPITFIDPNINDMTRTARVRVEIENPLLEENGRRRRELYHRLYAEGLVRSELGNVLTISRSSVVSPGRQAIAYVDLGNGSYEQRRLKLGRLGDEFWEVLEGLVEGEKVVTTGNLLIDAQAQLNQSARPTDVPPSTAPTDGTTAIPHEHSTTETRDTAKASSEPKTSRSKLTAPQQEAIRKFLVVANGVAQALASDSVDQFNGQVEKLHPTVSGLSQAMGDASGWQSLAQKLEATAHLQPAKDLAEARQTFLPFSTATAELAKTLREHEKEFGSLKIYQCPMVNRAIPGAPKTGQWVQTEEPLRNPFFGASMLTCGTEVKP